VRVLALDSRVPLNVVMYEVLKGKDARGGPTATTKRVRLSGELELLGPLPPGLTCEM
jgi:hypothetical protein